MLLRSNTLTHDPLRSDEASYQSPRHGGMVRLLRNGSGLCEARCQSSVGIGRAILVREPAVGVETHQIDIEQVVRSCGLREPTSR